GISRRASSSGQEVGSLNLIKAIVFDLDNTLVQSHIDYVRLKAAVLIELSRAGVPKHLIIPEESVVENFVRGKEYLERHAGPSDLRELDRRLDLVLTEIEMERVDQVQEIEGALALVKSLSERGIEVGVLTRGSRRYATTVLRRTGFDGQIEHLVCRDDFPMEEAKPNPLAMGRIAEKLNCLPEECLFIGDHAMDQECAKASGAGFIGVLTGSTSREGWLQAGCSVVMESVADLPQWLRERELSGRR
ncbi:MAG: HAD family hydrolase, partial [Methanomassiliicoccales archaeon]|nr:HAD family hydrolase [Methanomassiliicoccales archaeon]